MTTRPYRNHLTMALIALMLCTKASADSAARPYHISPQPLNSALMRFASDSNLELLYTADKLRAFKSGGLDGSMTPAQALSKLLQGSGMTFRFVDAGTVTIEPTSNFKKTAVVDEKPQPQSNSNDTSGETTLEKVTVEADADNPYDDPTWQADPYNSDYVLPKATAGTKTNTPVMETPLNVQVISKQVLKDQQVISLDKALRNVSGVTINRGAALGNTNSGNEQQLFLRGFETKTLFRNGFRMDGNAFGINQQFANVESIEVLKCPAAILYGRVEPGGMVNVTTKQPRATPFYSLTQQFGSYDLYRTSIDATGPLTKDDTLLYRVNTSFQSNNSFRDLVSGEDVFFAPILKWNISPRTQANLEMEYNRSLSNLDTRVLPVVNNRTIDLPHSRNLGERNPVESENIFVGFNWSHQFNDDWSIKHQVSYKGQDSTLGASTIVDSTAPSILPNNRLARFSLSNKNSTDTIATNLDLTGHFKTWALEHTLLFGGDYYRFDTLDDTIFWDFDNPISFEHPIHNGTKPLFDPAFRDATTRLVDNYGLYLQDQIKLPYNIHVMGGLRYQYVHSTSKSASEIGSPFVQSSSPQTDDAVTPRVGLLWNPKKWLSLYSNYAENFGANQGAFGFGGIGPSGQPLPGKPLPPQSAQQWEIGAKTELFDGRLRATLAYYDLTKQNVATADFTPGHICSGGQPGSCSIAIGKVRSRGPELDIRGEILPGWNVIATYANQDVRITKSTNVGTSLVGFEEGNRLQFVPRNTGSVWTSYEVQQGNLKGFKIGGGVTLQDSVVNSDNKLKSPGYALVGLLTGYSFEVGKSKINLQLNVDNLLDKSYITNVAPTGVVSFVNFSTPRTFTGSINVEY